MQFSAITIATLAAAAFSPLVSGTVFLGLRTAADKSQEQVAYTNGTPDPCSGFTTIVSGSGNPCGINFNVDGNNGPFTFEGCGGVGLSLDRNGAFNSNCKSAGKKISCPGGSVIQQSWECS